MNPASGQSEALIIQGGQLYQVAREPLSKTGWTLRGLGAGITSVSAVDSASAWVNFIGTSAYQKISTGYWSSAVTTDGRDFTAPVAGSDGTIRAFDTSYQQLVQLDLTDPSNPQWVSGPPNPPVNGSEIGSSPGGTAANLWLAAGADFNEVTREYEYSVWNFNGTQWLPPTYVTSITDNPLVQALVAPDSSVWLLTNNGTLLSALPQQWTQVPNLPGPILSAGAVGAGTLWAVIQPTDSDNPVLYTLQVTVDGTTLNCSYEEVSGPFELFQGGLAPEVSCGGVDGTLWLTDSNGTLWKFLPGLSTEWQRQIVPPGLPSTFGGGISEVVVINNGDSPTAFFAQTGSLMTCNFADGSWQAAQVVANSEGSPIAGCSGLTVAQDDQGVMFLHAAISEGLVAVFVSGGVASANIFSSKVPLVGSSVQISASSAQWIVLVATESGELYVSLGNSANPTKSFNQVKVSGMPQSIQSSRFRRPSSTSYSTTIRRPSRHLSSTPISTGLSTFLRSAPPVQPASCLAWLGR